MPHMKENYWESKHAWGETFGWGTLIDSFDPMKRLQATIKTVGNSAGKFNDPMKSLEALQSEVQGMKKSLASLEEKMLQTEQERLEAKEEACGAKERIVSLEALVMALQEEIRELAAGRSNCPSPPASGSDHPHAGLKDAESEAPPCNEWHEHRPDALGVPVSGNQEREADEWPGHLRNTLFG